MAASEYISPGKPSSVQTLKVTKYRRFMSMKMVLNLFFCIPKSTKSRNVDIKSF